MATRQVGRGAKPHRHCSIPTAVLDNCQDVIDSILKLMRDEKNIEDAQKKTTNFSPTFASREIQTIGDDTQKYIRFL